MMQRVPQRSTLAAQTVAILRERILSREWQRWLPGEHELCGQLRVARMTLRRALQQLSREGLIRSKQGKRREITLRRRKGSLAASGRVVLLTPIPMHLQLPLLHVYFAGELRDALAESGFHLEIHADRALYRQGATSGLQKLLQQLRPVAWVLTQSTATMQRWFSRHRLPSVILGSRYPGVTLPCVDKAYRATCRHAVGLFLVRGHRRLALINPDGGAAGDLESEQGFNEGIAQSNRQDAQGMVVRHDGGAADICGKLDILLARPDPPSAFLVSRAMYVITVVGHLMRRGRRLPQDVSVISRDYEPFIDQVVPNVARYVVSPKSMANRFSAVVLETARGGLVDPADSLIMPKFIEGETLGPNPKSDFRP